VHCDSIYAWIQYLVELQWGWSREVCCRWCRWHSEVPCWWPRSHRTRNSECRTEQYNCSTTVWKTSQQWSLFSWTTLSSFRKISKFPAVLGTMKIHSFTAHCDGTLIYRDLTCYCSNSECMCNCYPKKVMNISKHMCYCSNSECMCDCYPKKVMNISPEDLWSLAVPDIRYPMLIRYQRVHSTKLNYWTLNSTLHTAWMLNL